MTREQLAPRGFTRHPGRFLTAPSTHLWHDIREVRGRPEDDPPRGCWTPREPGTDPPLPRFLVIVRREAVDRYAQLREVFDREGVSVLWDRRVGERRRMPDAPWPAPRERRRADRRRAPPSSWLTLDFVIGRRPGSSALE